MVEFVTDDRVFSAEQSFKQAAVGIEAGSVEDCVLRAEEVREAILQLLVDALRAANETHAG